MQAVLLSWWRMLGQSILTLDFVLSLAKILQALAMATEYVRMPRG